MTEKNLISKKYRKKKCRFDITLFFDEEKHKYETKDESKIAVFRGKRYKKINRGKDKNLMYSFYGLTLKELKSVFGNDSIIFGKDEKKFEKLNELLKKCSGYEDWAKEIGWFGSALDDIIFYMDNIFEGKVQDLGKKFDSWESLFMKDSQIVKEISNPYIVDYGNLSGETHMCSLLVFTTTSVILNLAANYMHTLF